MDGCQYTWEVIEKHYKVKCRWCGESKMVSAALWDCGYLARCACMRSKLPKRDDS